MAYTLCTVTVDDLNIRAQPTSQSALVATYPRGTVLNFIGIVNGENVDGNPRWGHSQQGHYFWLGGTDYYELGAGWSTPMLRFMPMSMFHLYLPGPLEQRHSFDLPLRLRQQGGVVLQEGGHFGVLWSSYLLKDQQCPLEEWLRLLNASLSNVELRQVMETTACVEVVGVPRLLKDRQGSLKEWLRLLIQPLLQVALPQAIQAVRHIGVIGPYCPLTDSQGSPVEPLSLCILAACLVDDCQVVEGKCDTGVLRSQRLLVDGQGALVQWLRKVDPSVKTLREAVLRATLLLFFLKTHGFNAGLPPVSENTLQLGFGTPALDEAVCDCTIRNSSAIGSVPLLVRYTHAG